MNVRLWNNHDDVRFWSNHDDGGSDGDNEKRSLGTALSHWEQSRPDHSTMSAVVRGWTEMFNGSNCGHLAIQCQY